METASSNHSEGTEEKANSSVSAKKLASASSDNGKVASKPLKSSAVGGNARTGESAPSTNVKSRLTKPTLSSSMASSVQRRVSAGGLTEKRTRPENGAAIDREKASPAASEPGKRSAFESRRASTPSISPKAPVPRLSSRSLSNKSDPLQKSSARSSVSSATSATSSLKKVPSSMLDGNTGRSRIQRAPSSVSSPRTPSGTSSFKSRSLSASVDKSSSLSRRRKSSTPDSREARFMMLPQVDIKAGDDLRLDLRGHKVRSLSSSGLSLSPNLEFVYLRDNLLSSIEGIDILKRVKVLDLSFNDFKVPEFGPLGSCKALQQLYLAGNQITSLASLPQLPCLEFLSVAQNRLKSLCMASQPRLQVLAASKNKISTLKGFPHLPVLEHLRVEENPIVETPHLEAAAILLVGPTLKKFNNRDLSPKEFEISKLYPAHTALCIRDGWEFCHPELAADSTFSFLLEQWKQHIPSGYTLKEASVDQPFEEDACRCHFQLVSMSSDSELVLNYQWYVGDKTPTNFAAIDNAVGQVYWPTHEDVGKFLKVECTPVLKETEYQSIYAISAPVSPGTGHPKVVSLTVNGELVEGNVIRGCAEIAWCGGTPGKGVASWLRRRWNSSPVVILGAEDEEYRLSLDDIDSSLVFMYTPVTEEGTKGEPQYAMTDFVKAALPSVSNVQIIGDPVEGNTIKGIGDYFGGKEGPSKFEWLRESKETGGFVLASLGTTEYVLTKEDVGRRLAFVYIPINFEGQEGESASARTEIVKKAPPRVTNLKIVGDLREGSKVTVTAIVTGGTEGSSRVQLFKAASPKLNGEYGLEAISTSKIAKAFRIPLDAVGYYIVAKFTPMAPDGETGEPAYVVSDEVVETLPPTLNFLSVTGDCCEGEILTASYGYIGGHEGKSIYKWYLHETENSAGTVVSEALGLLQYRITKDAVGKFVSFKCTPVRDDGTVGEPRTCLGQERIRPGNPKLLSLQILGECVEGTTLIADRKYWGGEEGDSVFRWFLTRPDGEHKEIEGAKAASYTLSRDDIGFIVSVSCEPVRSDGARGPVVVSEQLRPVLPGLPSCLSLEFSGPLVEGGRLGFNATYIGGERGCCSHEWFRLRHNGMKDRLSGDEFLDLMIDDVDHCIELIFTPVRNDGVRGSPKNIISKVIAPADPKGIELRIPSCLQDQEIVPVKSYYGGKEGCGEYTWYRVKEKLEESELHTVTGGSHDAIVVGSTLSYRPSLEDIGFYLALQWVPTRSDGKLGETLVAISNEPVMAALPVVSDVCLKEIGCSVYAGEGKYYGGYEGSSLYSWYRETNEGTTILISGVTSTSYQVTDPDYNCRLLFGYTPVRSDSVVGELKLSEPSNIILPGLLEIERFYFTGKEVEGEKLIAFETIPESEFQRHIWSKYKKEIKFQWFYSVGTGAHASFEPFPSQCTSSYKVRLEDVGCCLKCECTVTDVFGRLSGPVSAVTSPIFPGTPRISKLEIEGRGYHTNLYAVRGMYSGGKEGKSKIQWLRSMVGSPDLISIPGEIGRMYEANVDDVGYRLVAIYTPVREDGVEGEPSTASTEPIAIEPDVHKEVKQKLEAGSVKFEVLCDKDLTPKKGPGLASLERRILEVNRKRVKVVKPGSKTSFPSTEIRGTYAPPFHVELYRNDQHRFKIVVDSENEVDLMVQTRHMRDVIVLVIRGLAQKFNSTSLNSLLKVET